MRDPGLKRILMTGDTVGGVWTFTLELAEVLGTYGIDVVLAAMGGLPTDAQRAEAERIPGLELLPSSHKLEWMEDPWKDVEDSGRLLLDLEKRYEPDVVHLNTYGHGALGWRSPVILTAHSCVASWWRAVKREPLPATWKRYSREVARSFRAATEVTAPSRAMLNTIAENYTPALPDCRVVPNGRDGDRFRAASKEPFVLTAGRLWDEAKNVAAVARIANRLPWPVYLAGDDRPPGGGPSPFGDCRMLGRLASDDLARWYGRASIYALPARYEPFGLSVLEAALSQCALVLGDIASLREIWQDAAIYVDPDDSDRLEESVRELIADAEYRQSMGQRAAARAAAFTPERMAAGYLEVYCAAAESRREAACAS